MTGNLIIDNVDVWTTYGAWLTDQSVNGVLSWPASKKVDTVSWAESVYQQADLSELKLAGKTAKVDFAMRGEPTAVADFASFLAASVTRTWNIASLGRTYAMRYIGSASVNADTSRQTFSVTVGLDSPLAGYTYAAPVSHIASVDEYSLDGTRLSNYGVRVLYGTLDSTARPDSVKELLSRDISTIDGITYDTGGTNHAAAGDIVLQCAMIETTLAALWRNYDALLYDLVKRDTTATYDTDFCRRSLYSYNLDKTFNCYYKSQSVSGFYPKGNKIWLIFNLTLARVK